MSEIWGTWLPYFAIAAVLTFLVSLVLLALRTRLAPTLVVGPLVGLAVVGLIDRVEPLARGDVAVLVIACSAGGLLTAWPVPFARWVYRVFAEAERVVLCDETEGAARSTRRSSVPRR